MRKLTLRGEDGAEKPFIAISTFCAAGWHPKLFRKGASWLFRIRTSYFPVNRTYTGLFARTARDVLPVATTQKAHNTSYERWEFTKKKRFKDKDFSKDNWRREICDLIGQIYSSNRKIGASGNLERHEGRL